MYCPSCGSYLSFRKNQCDRCREDLNLYKKVFSLSNRYYNDGLVRAKIRDLSGAVGSLKKSLQLNKKNTDARNLLGLVYYEMGETVSALGQWVISKHFQPEKNNADRYINELQDNLSKLESINQTIKKFNYALSSAKMGSEDLAIIQLKKVLALNPRFLRALQLISLLYIKSGEYEKAYRHLKKADKIDRNNTVTLSYLKELEEVRPEAGQETAATIGDKKTKREGSSSYIPVSTYKEEKPNVFLFINLIIGVVLGLAVMYFLITPTMEKRMAEKNRTDVIDYSQELSDRDGQITVLEKEKADLTAEVDKLNREIENAENTASTAADEALYDDLLKAADTFVKGDSLKAADALTGVDQKQMVRPAAKSLYNSLKEKTYAEASKSFYESGHKAYNAGKYEDAMTDLQKSLDTNPDNVDAIYFMGRSYDRLGDKEKAAGFYNKIIQEYPDSRRVNDARQKLGAIE